MSSARKFLKYGTARFSENGKRLKLQYGHRRSQNGICAYSM